MLKITPYHLLLLFVAAIWGSGFVAQRTGMDSLGPYSFNAARFALASLSLLPIWWFMSRKLSTEERKQGGHLLWTGGFVAGTLMYAGFTFQQVGLQYTTAGNAGFITSIYIVIVPFLVLVMGQKTRIHTWVGIILAVIGLYKLSVNDDFSMNKGDIIVLAGAFFWAAHVVTLGWISPKIKDHVGLSVIQFVVAFLLATITMLMLESHTVNDFVLAWIPLLYSGIVVSGVAFTLQIIGQSHVTSSTAALILSLEAVFAVLAGWLLLGEHVGSKELIGCGLMLAGMMISQWPDKSEKTDQPSHEHKTNATDNI